jgi:hypothetical protein
MAGALHQMAEVEWILILLIFRMKEKLPKKISPPFEGGVVGTIDYHIFAVFYFPTGVVDFSIISKNTKKMKTGIINQPPRPQFNFA